MKNYTFTDTSELRQFLLERGIPVWDYGAGEAKTLEQLFYEIVSRECWLSTESGRVVRSVKVVCLNIYRGGKFLVEDRQVFADGRMRRRPGRFSLGEKLKRGVETTSEALERLMREEMFRLVFCERSTPSILAPQSEWGESHSYPGILSRYEFYRNEVFLPEKFVLPLVVHEKDGKIAHYRWDEV